MTFGSLGGMATVSEKVSIKTWYFKGHQGQDEIKASRFCLGFHKLENAWIVELVVAEMLPPQTSDIWELDVKFALQKKNFIWS